jgi:MFS family permease
MHKLFSRELISVIAVVGMATMAMSLLQPVLPLYLTDIGVNPTALGFMFSVGMMGMVLGESFGGWLADRSGIRVPLFIGTFLCVPIVLAFVLFKNTATLFAIFFVWGVVRAAVFGPGRGYIGTNIPLSNKATFMAVFAASMAVSRALGTSISGFIVDILEYDWTFIISAGISLAGGLLVITGLKKFRPSRPIEVLTAIAADSSEPEVPLYRHRPFIIQSIIAALYFTAMGTTSFLSILAVQKAGVPVTQVGILFTISAIVNAILLIPMGRLADLKSKRVLMMVGLLVTAAGFAGISFSHNFLQLAASQVFGSIGGSMFSPAAVALLSENISRHKQSTAMGIYGGCEDVGVIVGSALSGVIWSVLEPRFTFLIVGALPGVIGAGICYILLKDKSIKKGTVWETTRT